MKKLTKEILKFRDQRNWKKHQTPKAMAISLLLESAELLEIFQWTKDNKIPKSEQKHFEEELADVFYWILLIAHENKIDIKKALTEKMKKNRKKYPLK